MGAGYDLVSTVVFGGRREVKFKRLMEVLKWDVSSGEEGAQENKAYQQIQGQDHAEQPTLLQCKQVLKGAEVLRLPGASMETQSSFFFVSLS